MTSPNPNSLGGGALGHTSPGEIGKNQTIAYLYWTSELSSKLSLLVYDGRLLNDSATLHGREHVKSEIGKNAPLQI